MRSPIIETTDDKVRRRPKARLIGIFDGRCSGACRIFFVMFPRSPSIWWARLCRADVAKKSPARQSLALTTNYHGLAEALNRDTVFCRLAAPRTKGRRGRIA